MLTIFDEDFNDASADFCHEFISNKDIPRLVLGINAYAANIAGLVDVDGFIDDYTTEKSFLGKPIYKMNEVEKNSLVVSAVILGRLVTAINNLKKNGLKCLDYFNFLKYSNLGKAYFLDEAKKDIEVNYDKYLWVSNLLGDSKSRDTFENIVNFRSSYNLYYMDKFLIDYDEQYFDDILNLKAGEVFVDAGGFDGQTVVNFISRCPKYKSVHFFEPDPENLAIAQQRLSGYKNVHFHKLGLGERKGTLKFSTGGGSASAISDTGDIEIVVDTIDNTISEPVTMIKMDIEGSEISALRGAKKHILNDHPKLAICCYHKIDDLWKIPEEVFAIRDDYSIYIRHYSEGIVESVMYFIPQT